MKKEIEVIVSKELKGKLVEITELTGGYFGHVYKVMVEISSGLKPFAIKIVNSEKEKSFRDESSDNRVYGSRWSNLKPAQQLLTENGFVVPKIFSIGALKSYRKNYSIMEFIEGEPVVDLLKTQDASRIKQLHGLAGDVLGKMHKIKRDFQGWVDMKCPYDKDWEIAFFESFNSHLKNAIEKNSYISHNKSRILEFVSQKRKLWANPNKFVFSHTDGFQGLSKLEKGNWTLTSIIDCEDNQFTDQRFVLSGLELALEFENKTLHSKFWERYKQHTDIDPGHLNLKGVFKLYYLLSWTPVAYDSGRHTFTEQDRGISRIENLIAGLVH